MTWLFFYRNVNEKFTWKHWSIAELLSGLATSEEECELQRRE